MTKLKHEKPRANPPVCWERGRRLHAGGRAYEIVTDEAGNDHPAHVQCAKEVEAAQ